MSDDHIIETIREAISKRRGYADGRSWPLDRQLEERGVAEDFVSAAASEPGAPFGRPTFHKQGDDPPDCETSDCEGRRIALEITEIVDRKTVEAVAAGCEALDAVWTADKLIGHVAVALSKKDFRDRLKGGPYYEYFVILYTAEPNLDAASARQWLGSYRFSRPDGIDRAYLSLDYYPGAGYPLIRLLW